MCKHSAFGLQLLYGELIPHGSIKQGEDMVTKDVYKVTNKLLEFGGSHIEALGYNIPWLPPFQDKQQHDKDVLQFLVHFMSSSNVPVGNDVILEVASQIFEFFDGEIGHGDHSSLTTSTVDCIKKRSFVILFLSSFYHHKGIIGQQC